MSADTKGVPADPGLVMSKLRDQGWGLSNSTGDYWVAEQDDGEGVERRYEIPKHLAPTESQAWLMLHWTEQIHYRGFREGYAHGRLEAEREHNRAIDQAHRILGITRLCSALDRLGNNLGRH